MKTQLWQDIDDSGSQAGPPSIPAAPPHAAPDTKPDSLIERAARPARPVPAAPAPRPAPAAAATPRVWRRPQMVPDAAVHGGATGAAMPRKPEAAPFAAPPIRSSSPPPPLSPPAASPPQQAASPDPALIPDWLAARLREDHANEGRAEWRSLWQRRIVSWSMAAGILAVLAAGGLWLYQESRVDEALVVVANTTPEPNALPVKAAPILPLPVPVEPAVRPVEVRDAPTETAIAPPKPEPSSEPPAELAMREEAPVAGAVAGAASGAAVVAKKAADRKPSRRAARSKVARASSVRGAGANTGTALSARQRREETLMQCRAHGYDQRQCDRRECEMTRFGFACKG